MRIFDRAVAETLPAVPRPIVRRLSSRYIAGQTLDAALDTVARLNSGGQMATIDVLGESVGSMQEADENVDEYRRAMDAISVAGLDSNISVKLSAFGIELDGEAAYRSTASLVSAAADHGMFVRIDMEDSSLTDATLEVYRRLRADGLENCGVVLQAYMRRALSDVRALASLRPNVRLVKGIYLEPHAVAYQDPGTIQRNFVELHEELVAAGCYVAVATHDPVLVDEALRVVERHGLEPQSYEFQLLLGVAEQMGADLSAAGRRVRIYVPYGRAWYSYAVRRLKENPSIAGHVARDTLRRVVPGL